jgi:hypothetical protein
MPTSLSNRCNFVGRSARLALLIRRDQTRSPCRRELVFVIDPDRTLLVPHRVEVEIDVAPLAIDENRRRASGPV